ncbi:hypothetical protein [Streptomyces sp. NPDC097610]|uniref:hypothetical protein n=1 Tax=Streptomyces sp. NPDC097610 TaxID=3157227 RepID=UPI003332CC39
MTLALAAVPSPAHNVARWVLDRLGPELWELDGLLDTAILRNRHGHEILMQAERDAITLAAQVNLADDDDAPLTTIREVRMLPVWPGDPVVADLLDVIRYRLAPAYGRENVAQAVAVLSAPLIGTPAVRVRIQEDGKGGRATMEIGGLHNAALSLVITRVPGAAPNIVLVMQQLSLPLVQEVVRTGLNAFGHAIPAPRAATPGTLRTMLAIARGEASPEALADSGSAARDSGDRQGPPVYSARGLVVAVDDGMEQLATLYATNINVQMATAMLYAYARQG